MTLSNQTSRCIYNCIRITDALPVQDGIVKQTILPKLINYVLCNYLVIPPIEINDMKRVSCIWLKPKKRHMRQNKVLPADNCIYIGL